MARIALYLAGGGARGAYQAGVLKAVQHILDTKELPFTIISGVSVGSINAAILADHANDFSYAVEKLEDLWQSIHCHDIFHAQNYDLSKSILRNLSHLFVKGPRPTHLLETTPLQHFLADNIDFDHIQTNIDNNLFETLEIITHCYELQQTISFCQHNQMSFENWQYPRHISKSATINLDYILASSALPLFFPPTSIDKMHYGDGSMGLISPLRGAVRSQVEKILILGTRQVPTHDVAEQLKTKDIGLAHVLGSMLNGLFLDNLDRDVELVNRMNEISHLLSMWKKRSAPWRPIDTLHLRPSIDISKIAQADYHAMPKLLRIMLNLLGAQSHSGDLLSFLLFESTFTQDLVRLGYQDTMATADQVVLFFK
ncbi:MAG: patatin-like phospholipase family protein [Gammaproteobacteria bacterium]|nr:patatin-like phospholipase family protein [Gammaproteobacteria bacterium]